MVALLQNEFVEEKKWVTKEEFLDMVAIAESTPGPVAVNSATYIGYKIEGAAGAAASTVAVCLPSFAVIYLISLFFDQFLRLSVVASAFHGIQVCVIYLILSAGLKMLKQLEHSVFLRGSSLRRSSLRKQPGSSLRNSLRRRWRKQKRQKYHRRRSCQQPEPEQQQRCKYS